MLKTFVLMIDDSIAGGRQTMQQFVDTLPEIVNWHAPLPNAIFLVSEKGAREIAKRIHTAFPASRFVVLEIQKEWVTRGGWMGAKTWDLIKNPKPA